MWTELFRESFHFVGTVAFQVDLDEYTTIPLDSVVIFDVVELNLGNQ